MTHLTFLSIRDCCRGMACVRVCVSVCFGADKSLASPQGRYIRYRLRRHCYDSAGRERERERRTDRLSTAGIQLLIVLGARALVPGTSAV